MMDNQPDVDDNVITTELEKGWKMHDRVLRAAKVRVNKK
jgi:molecular chaperone GrpE (heat shock protein)